MDPARPELTSTDQFDGFVSSMYRSDTIVVEAAAEMTRYHVIIAHVPNDHDQWLIACTNLSTPFVAQLPKLKGWHYGYLEGLIYNFNRRAAMAIAVILNAVAEQYGLE